MLFLVLRRKAGTGGESGQPSGAEDGNTGKEG